MAASDKLYRDQRSLDIVFGASSTLMLISVIWMFAQDYNREYKTEQRVFRDVMTALAQRNALDQLPSHKEFGAAVLNVDNAREARDAKQDDIKALRQEAADMIASRERADAVYQDIKASLDSKASFYDLAVEHNGFGSPHAKHYKDEVEGLLVKLIDAQSSRDEVTDKIRDLRAQADSHEKPLTDVLGQLKQLNDRFDAQAKIAITKQWTIYDFIRNLPIIDGFAAPVKIEQFTLDNLPIDYNFKSVTRFDRCMSCHAGIDRTGYTKAALDGLKDETEQQKKKLADAQELLKQRREALTGLPEIKDVAYPYQLGVNKVSLSHARVNEFAAHPRLEMFVGSNSKHPAEKFGCTICHSGQGSATDFQNASHTPNNEKEKEEWVKNHGWQSNHFWDFPMLPHRFVESSCLKCHHEVTDLITTDNRNQAPRLLQGYHLLRENGCFGCHEIAGRKNGRQIGPDIRLESVPPLDDMTATERQKVMADPDTAPGHMRKVGPSLYRVSEKTNAEWMVKWLRAPREFRPDTKMPHFYGLSNNNPHKLSDELDGPSQLPKIPADDQTAFPATEMHAITYYLLKESQAYIDDVTRLQKVGFEARRQDMDLAQRLQAKDKLTKEEKADLDQALDKIRRAQAPPRLADLPLAMDYKQDLARGRKLFSEKGCLACHHHDSTMTDGDGLPALPSEANFGPDLSQVKAKLGQKPGDEASSKRWLMQWIKDPHFHSPRSRMPITHMTNEEIADVAAWLLKQDPDASVGPKWAKLATDESLDKEPSLAELQKLADIYLRRLLAPNELKKLKAGKKVTQERVNDLPPGDRQVVTAYNDPDTVKHYLGKKAVGRLGCFGCHDVPGFDNAKTIGVGLNDWGKKSPERLAFEDSKTFLEDNFVKEDDGKPFGADEYGKASTKRLPFDAYLGEALLHHMRDGYLNLKVRDPRSYDYNRIRPWDDRARMPQFKLARMRRHEGETDKDYHARQEKAETDAREAIMTFVLGLVAEPIPAASVNQPTGDRLAEVKGRQVLDKYNCGGCHLVRPGVYNFNMTPGTLKQLQASYSTSEGSLASDYNFYHHKNWIGHLPPGGSDNYQSMAVRPGLFVDGKTDVVTLAITEALRFQNPATKETFDIRAGGNLVRVLPDDMTFPPPEVFKLSAEEEKKFKAIEDVDDRNEARGLAMQKQVRAWEAEHGGGSFGGTFADLLVPFVIATNKADYPPGTKDSGNARASVPPILLGQGERTQPDWLVNFLKDPGRVRRMTVLRMPKFNMSHEEAQALVAYFAGVDRLTNPGIGLTFPQDAIPQQADLTQSFWRDRTKAYVQRLKANKLFDQRVKELTPVWTQYEKDLTQQAKDAESKRASGESKLKELKAALEKASKEEKHAKDSQVKEAERFFAAWEMEAKRLKEMAELNTVKKQQKAWQDHEAYVTDGFRILANREPCLKCHQLGNAIPGDSKVQGPPLDLSYVRLRPGWTERWLANPQRFLTYPTVMPQNFAALPEKAPQPSQDLFVGDALQQLTGLRDVMMIYPRAAEMPVNRDWSLPLTAGDKK